MNRKLFILIIFFIQFIIIFNVLSLDAKAVPIKNQSKFSISSQNEDPKAVKYYKSNSIVEIIRVILSILIPSLFLFTGLSASMRKFSEKFAPNWYLSFVIYIILFLIISYILEFPFDFYSGFIQKHNFNISNQSLTRWLQNSAVSFGLNAAAILVSVWIPYRLMKISPQNWWIYTGIISIPIVIFINIIEPLYIDPLFNNFKHIDDKNIVSSINELKSKANISNCDIYEVDKSKDTNSVNAYMIGIGNTKRIVIWDTTIKKLNIKELDFITAHEMGHYVLGHIKIMIAFSIVGIFIVLYIMNKSSMWFIYKFGEYFKFNKIYDIASVPLMILIINICSLAINPISNAGSRYIEHQADIFALEITQDNDSAVSAFEKLSADNLTVKNPGPIYKFWNYDHPTMQERIDFCKSYKPWQKGQPLKFQKFLIQK